MRHSSNFLQQSKSLSVDLTKQENMLFQTGEDTKAKIIAMSTWLTIQDLSQLLQCGTEQTSDLINTWKSEAKVFTVDHQGVMLLPSYALTTEGQPLTQLQNVLRTFQTKKSSWAIAAWFVSVNGWLHDERPIDLISTKPNALIQAAIYEITPIDHG